MLRGVAARALFPGARRLECGASSLRLIRANSTSPGFPPPPPEGAFGSPQTFQRSETDVAFQVRDLATDRKWQEALELFAAVSEPSQLLRLQLLRACTRSFQVRQAWQVFQEMQVRELPAYNLMICMLCKQAKYIDQVRGLVQEMRSQSLQPDGITARCLMTAYSHAGDAEGAVGLMAEMESRGMPVTKEALSCALIAHCKSGDHAKARELLSTMDSMHLHPTSEDLTYYISAYTQSQDEEGARAALAELRKRGLRPIRLTYTRLAGCLSGPEAFRKVEALLTEMRAEGIEPHLLFFKMFLRAATMSEDPADILKVLREMDSRGIFRDVPPMHELTPGAAAAQKGALQEACTSNDIRDLTRVLHQMYAAGSSSALGGSPGALPAAEQPLPAGWQQALDPTSGKSYFWREADPNGSVTWERPS